ncbi:MAG: hypothetical protein IPJ65_21505 [Archangiaceae bacterium]|nr:hypothetical protein [Archangiaceae bacterium]
MTKLFVVGAMLAAVCVPEAPGPGEVDARDVRGNYDVTYDSALKVQLNLGGALREVTASGYGSVVDFGVYNGKPVTLDLKAFCDREDVTCPYEKFWTRVAIDQPKLKQTGLALQELRVIDDEDHHPPVGKKAPSVSGLVNHDDSDRFLIGLGLQAGANQACAAIDVSFASGRFSHEGEKLETTQEYRYDDGQRCNPDAGTAATDAGASADAGAPTADAGAPKVCALHDVTRLTWPDGAEIDGIKEGKVGFAWAGGCAFGPALIGATLYLETAYTGTRTGDFDPPPFTPEPVTQPDAGFPDDAGAADGG